MDHEKNNMKCLQGTTWKDQRRESVQFKVKLVRKHLYRRSAGPESFSDGQFQPSEAQWWREQRKKYDYYYREAIETSPAEVSNVHERFYVDRPTNWIIRSKKKTFALWRWTHNTFGWSGRRPSLNSQRSGWGHTWSLLCISFRFRLSFFLIWYSGLSSSIDDTTSDCRLDIYECRVATHKKKWLSCKK